MDTLDHQLIALLRQDARASIATLAHKLKGAAGGYGFRRALVSFSQSSNRPTACNQSRQTMAMTT